MRIENKFRGWVLLASAGLLLCLLVYGCGGITPYQPRNSREEGPERGIFTGPQGEFVIPLPGEPAKENESGDSSAQ